MSTSQQCLVGMAHGRHRACSFPAPQRCSSGNSGLAGGNAHLPFQDQFFMEALIEPHLLPCSEQLPPTYLLPAIEVHAGQFAIVGFRDVDVERLALVDESSSVCCHLEDSFLGDLPHCLIKLLQVSRNLRYILKGRVSQCSITRCYNSNARIHAHKPFTNH